ncbi:hypothetical protein ACQPZK_07530 [Micromonospora sp. CA-249363]|uniref:hypothetical protein n=1 Tax=Micromonospora sp. CA-249363 TaxID=3239963 RepID=UPI003D91D888
MTSDGWTEIVATATPKTANERAGRMPDLEEWLKPYGLEVENVSILWVKKAGDTYTLVANEFLRRDGHLYLDKLTNTPASREISVRVPANSWPDWMNTKHTETCSYSRDVEIGKTRPVMVGEPGPEKLNFSKAELRVDGQWVDINPCSAAAFALTGSPKVSKVNGKRPSDKVIKLARDLGIELETWQRVVIRQWFDK